MITEPDILILDEPTRGIDKGAKFEIYSIIYELAKAGMAIIFISSEMPEIIGMCDRVYVLNEGEIVGELNRDELHQENIMKHIVAQIGGKRMKSKKINLDMKKYGMFILLIAIFLLFYVLSSGKNATAMNINNLIMQNSYVVILAIGMLLCVLTGNVDLGVGSVVALTGAICAILVIDNGMSTP